MRRTKLHIAAVCIVLVSARFDPAPVAHAEVLLAGTGAGRTTATNSSPDAACLRLGACVNKRRHNVTPVVSETYPDGLHWDGDGVSLKFTGNRVKFRLHF